MTLRQSPVLELPAMLHGSVTDIRRKVRTESREWVREYLKTGAFAQPRQMLPVSPGEVLLMHSAAEFDALRPGWRMHMFVSAFTHLDEGVPKEERPRMGVSFESFCLGYPWGALYHAVSPPPPRSAECMVPRFTALLRFWDVLQGPRYAYRLPEAYHSLEQLLEYIYRETLEAWCPGGPASIREHLALATERMARATREDCLEAVLRMMPVLVKANPHLKHREVLADPDFLRERLTALSPGDFEDFSSAYLYTVNVQLAAWDRELGRS